MSILVRVTPQMIIEYRYIWSCFKRLVNAVSRPPTKSLIHSLSNFNYGPLKRKYFFIDKVNVSFFYWLNVSAIKISQFQQNCSETFQSFLKIQNIRRKTWNILKQVYFFIYQFLPLDNMLAKMTKQTHILP